MAASENLPLYACRSCKSSYFFSHVEIKCCYQQRTIEQMKTILHRKHVQKEFFMWYLIYIHTICTYENAICNES